MSALHVQATYDCAVCGHSHSVGNLVLHCGLHDHATFALLWVAQADRAPIDMSTSVVPATYLDAGLIEFFDWADPTKIPTRMDLVEYNSVSLALARHGGRRHLVIDVVDGASRVRWSLPNAAVTPRPQPKDLTTGWRCPLSIDVDPAKVERRADLPRLD